MRSLLRKISRYSVSVFIVLLIFLIIGIMLVEAIGLFNISSISDIVTSLGALGTLLLAWATLKTVRQNEDIITQREAKIRPKVRRVGEYSVNEGLNDSLVLELENVGSGKAINLQIIPILYILQGSTSQSIFDYTKQSSDIPTAKSYSQGLVTSDKNPLDYAHEGAVLESCETESFALRPDWRNLDVDIENYDPDSSEEPSLLVFERIIGLFDQSDVQEMGFRFKLTYEDIVGNEYEENLDGPRFVLEEVDSLSDGIGRYLWKPGAEDTVIVHSNGRSG